METKKGLFMKTIVQTLALITFLGAPISLLAEKSMEELSKEIANPLAQIWNLSFQNNYTTVRSDLVDGEDHINTALFQPVLPIPLDNGMTAFARPVFTFITAPTKGYIGGTPSQPVAHGTDREAALGDLILPVGVGVVQAKGWSYGIGATFIFPTSQHDLIASHQYQVGPTALALWANDDWMIGAHMQHWWGVAGDSDFDDKKQDFANHTDIQYFIVYHLPDAWQLRASPHITYNWNAKSDNKLTLPVAFGFGKMFKVGPMPIMLMAEYQKSLVLPDDIGSDSTIMIQANFIIKNPFGDL